MTKPTQRTVELSRRAFAAVPTSVDVENRRLTIILATETPCITEIDDPTKPGEKIQVEEVLSMAGVDFSRATHMSLLDNHNLDRGIDAILGRLENLRVEGTQLLADVVIRKSRADILEDIADGSFGQVSVGFYVNEYDVVDRPGQLPLATAVSWTPYEGSIVPVGADPNAVFRSARSFPAPTFRKRSTEGAAPINQEKKNMELEEIVSAAEAALEALAEAADEGASEEVVARAAKLRKLREDMLASEEEPAGERKIDPETGLEIIEQGDISAADEAEYASIEAAARRFGLLDDVKALRAAKVKPATARSLLAKGALASVGQSTRSSDLAPKRERKAETITLNSNAIFAKRAALRAK